jgi:hypothetical protein
MALQCFTVEREDGSCSLIIQLDGVTLDHAQLIGERLHDPIIEIVSSVLGQPLTELPPSPGELQ